MKYNNPIISGFHPDPSVCRVGEDYYLINSSFEYFPGIPVFHSKDMIHWQQIGHCITRENQLKLKQGVPNCVGIYAPTIRYHDGIFYVVTTNVAWGGENDGNFIVWTTDPAGEWSDPIYLGTPGIDSSLFFDDDGSVYYTGAADNAIFMYKLEFEYTYDGNQVVDIKCRIASDKHVLWAGTGGNDPEGPHIYRIGSWYYLMISEGGTEYCHMVTIARSKSVYGSYESCPRNPVLSNRSTSLPIKATGHMDLLCDHRGNWWGVCLGIRPITYPFKHNLGRETFLVPVKWDENGWPVMGRDGLVDEEVEVDREPLCKYVSDSDSDAKFYDDFSGENLKLDWNYMYNEISSLSRFADIGEGIMLYGNEHNLSDAVTMAWLGYRQADHKCIARTKLEMMCESDGDEAGITIYMNNRHHYEAALTRLDGTTFIIFRRQIGSLWKIENKIPYSDTSVIFELEAKENEDNSINEYQFSYIADGESVIIGCGEADYLTTEVGGRFTGNYIALYATGNGHKCCNGANFKWFEYKKIK